MMRKIINALQEHKELYEAATSKWLELRKELDSNYKGNLLTVKMNEGKEIYEETLRKSREGNFAVCVTVLDGIREKARDIIATPITSDFSNTIEALKLLKNPSRAELEAIAENHKGNYLAYRAICDALGGSEKGYNVISYDDVIEACDELEKSLRACFYGDSPATYTYRVHLNEGYMSKWEKLFSDFLEGRFMVTEEPEPNTIE